MPSVIIDPAVLRDYRKRESLTQTDIADRIGRATSLISFWETRRSEPSEEDVEKLLDAFPDLSREFGATFSTWLREAREERGLTVQELAQRSGVSAPAIYNIEAGRSENPREATRHRLERALGEDTPDETREASSKSALVEGLGEVQDFDPYDAADWPIEGGIYVFYDVSDRPIYVGQGKSIRNRVRDHESKFWFKRPIVERGTYIPVKDDDLRKQIEKTLIKFHSCPKQPLKAVE